jgi:hypothetical protein
VVTVLPNQGCGDGPVHLVASQGVGSQCKGEEGFKFFLSPREANFLLEIGMSWGRSNPPPPLWVKFLECVEHHLAFTVIHKPMKDLPALPQ